MIQHETVATCAIADKAMAYALRDRLLSEGRKAWLVLNTGPALTVSVHAEAAAHDPEAMTPGQERTTQRWIEYMRRCGVGAEPPMGGGNIELS